jgi:hypothetical protein
MSLVSYVAFAEEATFVHERAHLSTADIATVTGAAPSTVRAWLAHARIPSGERARRLAELSSIAERLLRVMDANYIPVWFSKPIPALHDEKPLDLMARGDYMPVARVIAELESPTFS